MKNLIIYVIQSYCDDVAGSDTFGEKVFPEKGEKKIGFTTPSDSRYDLNGTIPFPSNDPSEVSVPFNLRVATLL